MSKIIVTTAEARVNLEAIIKTFNELNDTIGKTTSSGSKNSKQLADELGVLEKNAINVVAAFELYRKTFGNISKSQQSYLTQQRKLKKELIETNTALKNITKSQRSYKTQLKNSKQETQELTKKIEVLTAKLKKSRLAFVKHKKQTSGVFSSLKTNVLSLIGAFGIMTGLDMFANVIKNGFVLIRTLDGISFAMKATIKDVEELSQTQSFLSKIMKAYGADLVTTTGRYVKFRTAANQAGLTALETQKIFGTFTKVSGVLGLRTDELTGIYLALEQMISKGKITTEELRRQLGERLPGAMDIMATSMGVTTAQLDDLLKKGEVITKDVLPKFAEQVNIAFGLDSVKKVTTLQAATTRLNNAWLIMLDDFRSGGSAVDKLRVTIDYLADNLKTVVDVVLSIVSAFILYKAMATVISIANGILSASSTLLSKKYLVQLTRQLRIIKVSRGQSVANITLAGTTALLSKAMTILNLKLQILWATMMANPILLAIGAFATILITAKALQKELINVAKEENKLAKEATELTRGMVDQGIETQALVKRYNKLAAVTNNYKSTIEDVAEAQKELNDILKVLGGLYPDAIDDVDKYGKALSLNLDKLVQLIFAEKELAAFQAKREIIEGKERLGKLKKELEGIIQLEKARVVITDKGLQSYEKMTSAQIKAHVSRKANLKEQIALSEEVIDQNTIMEEQLEEITFLYSDHGKELAAERAAQRAKEEAEFKMMSDAEKKRHKQTVAYIEEEIKLKKQALKVQQDGFHGTVFKDDGTERTPESYDDANAKANKIILKEIEALQKRYNKLMGIEDKTRSNTVRRLKEIKDLTFEIKSLEKEKQIIALNERVNNEEVWFEDRKNSVEALASLEIQKSKDVHDDKMAKAEVEFKTITAGNNIELNRGASGARKDALLENNANALIEFNQKQEIETLNHNARVVEIHKKALNTVIELDQEFNENSLNNLKAKFDQELIQLNDGNREILNSIYKNAAEQQKIINDPKSSLKERMKAEEALLQLKGDIAREEEFIGIARAEIERKMVNAIIEAKLELIKIQIEEAKARNASDEFIDQLQAQYDALEAGLQNLEIVILDTKQWQESLLEILDIVGEFSNAIMSIFDEVAEARIEKIGAEIQAEKDKYDELIALEEGNQLQQDLYARIRDEKVKKLEKKRLKEEQKQAKIQKAMAVGDIAIKLGQTIVAHNLAAALIAATPQGAASLGTLGAIYAAIQIPLAIATAAAQTAAVLAAPIPQFKDGGEIGIDLIGRINDGGKQEFVERNGQILTTKKKDAIVPLKAGDTVYRDYDDMIQNSMILNNVLKGIGIKETPIFDEHIIERAIENGFKKAKINNNINLYGIDAEQEAYKNKMSNWN